MGNEIMVCGCRFSKNGEVYHYCCEDAAVRVGDRVIVRVGDEGRVKAASVVTIVYCTAAQAPYPLDRMKTIEHRIAPVELPPVPKPLSPEELAERKRREEQADVTEEAFRLILLLLFAPVILPILILGSIGNVKHKLGHPRMRDEW